MIYSMNDGIWNIYYYILFVAIMVMWKPSENSSAYAYHLQVATNEQVSKWMDRIRNRQLMKNMVFQMKVWWIVKKKVLLL